MSKWRQRGFVQDSDEEEESQIESQNQNTSACQRVDVDDENSGTSQAPEDRNHGRQEKLGGDADFEAMHLEEEGGIRNAQTETTSARYSTPFPTSSMAQHARHQGLSESPDILHGLSSIRENRAQNKFVSSRVLGEPVSKHHGVAESETEDEEQPPLPQSSNSLLQKGFQVSLSQNAVQKMTDGSQILGEFGISPLSDVSESEDSLSDPPTDIDSPTTSYTSPHRRTAVQVVIPSSAALQRQLSEQGPIREFRHRKPIQLHPYLLEGERYRREFQSRGIKPVPRERSPLRNPVQTDVESQEQEFSPDEPAMSSPHDPEIPVSTPVIRRRRKAIMPGPVSHSTSAAVSRKLPATQVQTKQGAKRRKLNFSSTQEMPNKVNNDIWFIPPSPPFSSSPPAQGLSSGLRRLAKPVVATPVPNIPTPSTSSNVLEDLLPVLDSDSEPVPRSTTRSGGKLHRSTITIPSESSLDSGSSSEESEKDDMELRKVGKRIRGVLPASWLRLDQQAQERRKRQIKEYDRQRDIMEAEKSPGMGQPQRGVAQKVTKITGGSRQESGSMSSSKDFIVISDESDNGSDLGHRSAVLHNASVEDASVLATILDRRYAADDSDNMENDRLHLFTLGSNKRKRQTRLTDTFAKPSKPHGSGDGSRIRGPTDAFGGIHGKRKRSKKTRNTPPALSVIDFDLSSSEEAQTVPQFLRLARRQARQRPDFARQPLSNKEIRLHTARDTHDAHATLQQWRTGVLRPKPNPALTQPERTRSPLVDRVDNQQGSQQPITRHSSDEESKNSPRGSPRPVKQRKQTNAPPGLLIFQRQRPQKVSKGTIQPSEDRSKPKKRHDQSIIRKSHPFRTAQLEGDEANFSKGHRKLAFEKGLRRADQQFNLNLPVERTFMNPQLARFLADDGIALPPLPSANDIGEKEIDETPKPTPPVPKRRLVRKITARRIDVDTREYRQPSEPAVQELFTTTTADQVLISDKPSLEGFDTNTTRFPTTFDVSPLKFGTYFQSTTFVGAEELHNALQITREDSRDLDEPAGYCTISHNGISIRCGPWADETCCQLNQLFTHIWFPMNESIQTSDAGFAMQEEVLVASSKIVRSMIAYFSSHLSFLDSIDRGDFLSKMIQLIRSVTEKVSRMRASLSEQASTFQRSHADIRLLSYLLVLCTQVLGIATHPTIESFVQVQLTGMKSDIARTIIGHLFEKGIPELGDFLEKNKIYQKRENGIQDNDTWVECVVICMHALDATKGQGTMFWGFVSQELCPRAQKATHLKAFESIWASMFTLLPFGELDVCGILVPGRRTSFQHDDWTCIRAILKRIFELYTTANKKNKASVNDYIHANLTRCHVLIENWHWRRSDQMLSTVFDFFAKHGLKHLRRDEATGSVQFMENLAAEPSLSIEPKDNAFHIFLKCLALGIKTANDLYPEKKIRSLVFRFVPNHTRTYPKDQPLDAASLAALRNHHDLLCTLYWISHPSCRPSLDLIRDLVQHENSHREACRVNIRAWANLTTYQLSTNEPYATAQTFAFWLKEIIQQTLKEYRSAKIEADAYLNNGNPDKTSAISSVMVRQTMERNQEQVIAALRDCITGLRKAILRSSNQASSKNFLIDSGILQLLELPHLEDARLVHVIRDALMLLQDYASVHKNLMKESSQITSEDSQDYGDSSVFDYLDDIENYEDLDHPNPPPISKPSTFDFVQTPLWHLLSNAFGAETTPDENLLIECVDAWIIVTGCQVSSNERSWSYYIGSFAKVGWQQLRHTAQTKKFGPYFMAALIESDPSAYTGHRQEFLTALFSCLVDRESELRFQHCLLRAILQTNPTDSLLKNLPFVYNEQSCEWDITSSTLRTRRLPLISTLLANMRDQTQPGIHDDQRSLMELKSEYASMLKALMAAMKNNYQELGQGTGAYVEFVQKIVQFLTQYTSDICAVLPYFTDSVSFPLPAADPTYVVGRLCGYAPKLATPGVTKQLSVFIQTVAQQAAATNEQLYLVNQLHTSLCTDETPSADRMSLRSVLLQGIFPAYIEEAFSSKIGFIISKPVLQSLGSILDSMIFDLRVNDPDNITSMASVLVSISHAFIRGIEHLKTNPQLFEQPHTLVALSYMLIAFVKIVPLLDYILIRLSPSIQSSKPHLVAYMEELSVFIIEIMYDQVPETVPWYMGNADSSQTPHADLLDFCMKGLKEGIETNWSENEDSRSVSFGRGHSKREVLFDLDTAAMGREKVTGMIWALHDCLNKVYGGESSRDFGQSIVV